MLIQVLVVLALAAAIYFGASAFWALPRPSKIRIMSGLFKAAAVVAAALLAVFTFVLVF